MSMMSHLFAYVAVILLPGEKLVEMPHQQNSEDGVSPDLDGEKIGAQLSRN